MALRVEHGISRRLLNFNSASIFSRWAAARSSQMSVDDLWWHVHALLMADRKVDCETTILEHGLGEAPEFVLLLAHCSLRRFNFAKVIDLLKDSRLAQGDDAYSRRLRSAMLYTRALARHHSRLYSTARKDYFTAVVADPWNWEALVQLESFGGDLWDVYSEVFGDSPQSNDSNYSNLSNLSNLLQPSNKSLKLPKSFDASSVNSPYPLNKASSVHDTSTFLLQNLYQSRCARNWDQVKAGVEAVKSVISVDPKSVEHPQLTLSKAIYYLKRRKYDACYQELNRPDLKLHPWIQTYLIECLYSKAKVQTLHSTCTTLMNSDPTAPLTSYALGCYYLLIKNLDEAKRWFRKSFMVDGAFWRGYIGMGVAVLEEKEWDGVLRWCGGVGGTGSHTAPLLYGQALLARYLNRTHHDDPRDVKTAYTVLLEAQSLAPYDAFVLHELGTTCYFLDQWEESWQWYKRGLELLGHKIDYDGVNGNGKKEDMVWKEYVDTSPGTSSIAEPLSLGLGWSSLKLRRYTLATDQFRLVLKMNPFNTLACVGMGYIDHIHGRLEKAVEWYTKAKYASANMEGLECISAVYLSELIDESIKDLMRSHQRIDTNKGLEIETITSGLYGKSEKPLALVRGLAVPRGMEDIAKLVWGSHEQTIKLKEERSLVVAEWGEEEEEDMELE